MSLPSSVALVHYHLRRGGVTSVMLAAASILRDAGVKVVLVCGESPSVPVPRGIWVSVVPGIGYDQSLTSREAPELWRWTRWKVKETLGGKDPALWHIHNHSLGKNAAYSAMPAFIAAEGIPLILQPHDFSEDGRPGNFALLHAKMEYLDRLYPVGGNVRYAVLQARDQRILRQSGADPEEVHVLPNPVSGLQRLADGRFPASRFLYVTRGIRRKNVGELLLWAAHLKNDAEFGLTLLPENPLERAICEDWMQFANEQQLPVEFGVGVGRKSLEEVVEEYDACMTTSIAEGFGLSFLEPTLMNRPVVGRNLPEITAGFMEDGVALDSLYDTLPVPVDLLSTGFWSRASDAVNHARRKIASVEPISDERLRQVWTEDECIDFGRLDEQEQMHMIQKVVELDLPSLSVDLSSIEPNRTVIEETYSKARTLERLKSLYRFGVGAAPSRFLEGERIRNAFLDPGQWTLLRV